MAGGASTALHRHDIETRPRPRNRAPAAPVQPEDCKYDATNASGYPNANSHDCHLGCRTYCHDAKLDSEPEDAAYPDSDRVHLHHSSSSSSLAPSSTVSSNPASSSTSTQTPATTTFWDTSARCSLPCDHQPSGRGPGIRARHRSTGVSETASYSTREPLTGNRFLPYLYTRSSSSGKSSQSCSPRLVSVFFTSATPESVAAAAGRPILILAIAFLAYKAFLLFVAFGVAAFEDYDTSTDFFFAAATGSTALSTSASPTSPASLAAPFFSPEPPPSVRASLPRMLIGRLIHWDAVYFADIARRGYVFEHEWAFGPGFPAAIRTLACTARFLGLPSADISLVEPLSGVIAAHAAHWLAVMALHALTLALSRDPALALVSALFHVISPAGVFLSAPYAESSFACLSFFGFLAFAYGVGSARFTSALPASATTASPQRNPHASITSIPPTPTPNSHSLLHSSTRSSSQPSLSLALSTASVSSPSVSAPSSSSSLSSGSTVRSVPLTISVSASRRIGSALPSDASCYRAFWLVGSGALLGAATLCRSNGVLNGILFVAEALRCARIFIRRPCRPTFVYLLSVLTGGALIGLGAIAPQAAAYSRYCLAAAEPRKWCSHLVPSIYAYVQDVYWNVGFLRYWTFPQLPLFALAAPVIIFLVWSAIDLLQEPSTILNRPAIGCTKHDTGFSEAGDLALHHRGLLRKTDELNTDADADSEAGLRLMLRSLAVTQTVLTMLAVTSYHIQIINRISSGCPLWYWWAAACLTKGGGRAKGGRALCVFAVTYGAIQCAFFAAFLPPA